MYVELDLDFLGIVVPKVGVLITQEPNELLDENQITWCHQLEFDKIGLNFKCPTGIRPLLFSQLCVFHQSKEAVIQSDSVTLNTIGQQQLSN